MALPYLKKKRTIELFYSKRRVTQRAVIKVYDFMLKNFGAVCGGRDASTPETLNMREKII